MKKHSVKIAGHATSISLEQPFWDELCRIAEARDQTLSALITAIDEGRGENNLSSALRLFVLEDLKQARIQNP